MPRYRLLSETPNAPAGAIVDMPDDWQPHGGCEPLDAAAIRAFWSAGPVPAPLVRQQWSDQLITMPVIYWRAVGDPAHNMFQLTGQGAALGPKHAASMSLP
jgi:hypothetical protein